MYDHVILNTLLILVLISNANCFKLLKLQNSRELQIRNKVILSKKNREKVNLKRLLLFSQQNSDQEFNASEEYYSINNSSGESKEVDGYLNPDFKSLNEGKQFRVLLYVGLALIPCLLLVPFFMTRDFVPPTDPEAFR